MTESIHTDAVEAEVREGVWAEATRLRRVMPRLPEALQEECGRLCDEAEGALGTLAEGSLPALYAMGLGLERFWLEISQVGHAGENWWRRGYLFTIKGWKRPHEVGFQRDFWLRKLVDERVQFREHQLSKSIGFHERAIRKTGAGARAPEQREYDRMDTPEYEFIYED